MMSIWEMILEYWNTLQGRNEKKVFIENLKSFTNELKEELENE